MPEVVVMAEPPDESEGVRVEAISDGGTAAEYARLRRQYGHLLGLDALEAEIVRTLVSLRRSTGPERRPAWPLSRPGSVTVNDDELWALIESEMAADPSLRSHPWLRALLETARRSGKPLGQALWRGLANRVLCHDMLTKRHMLLMDRLWGRGGPPPDSVHFVEAPDA